MEPVGKYQSSPNHPPIYRCGPKTDQECNHLNWLTAKMSYPDVIFPNWLRKTTKEPKIQAPTTKGHLILSGLQYLQLWRFRSRSHTKLNQVLNSCPRYAFTQGRYIIKIYISLGGNQFVNLRNPKTRRHVRKASPKQWVGFDLCKPPADSAGCLLYGNLIRHSSFLSRKFLHPCRRSSPGLHNLRHTRYLLWHASQPNSHRQLNLLHRTHQVSVPEKLLFGHRLRLPFILSSIC